MQGVVLTQGGHGGCPLSWSHDSSVQLVQAAGGQGEAGGRGNSGGRQPHGWAGRGRGWSADRILTPVPRPTGGSNFTGTGLSSPIRLAGDYPGVRGKYPLSMVSSNGLLACTGCSAGWPGHLLQHRLGLGWDLIKSRRDLFKTKIVMLVLKEDK